MDLYLHPHTPSLSGQGKLYFLPLQPRHIPEETEEDQGNLSKNGWCFSHNPKRSPVECRCTSQQVATWTTLQATVVTVKGLNKPSLLEQSAQESIAGPTLGRDVTFKIILPPTSGLQVASFNDAFDGYPFPAFLAPLVKMVGRAHCDSAHESTLTVPTVDTNST